MTTGAPSGAMTRRPGQPDPRPAELGAHDVVVAAYPEEHDDAEPDRHQQGRHDRRGEEGAGRDRGQAGVDDGGDARRHHRRDQRGRADDAEREPLRVAGAQHRRDLQLAQRGRVGDRRAAHPREPQADADADVAEAAADPAEQGEREVEEPVGDAGVVGQAAQQDEQRHGEQREARGRAGDQPQRQAERLVGGDHVDQRRPDERERDRHPDHQQRGDQQAQDEQAHAVGASSVVVRPARGRRRRRTGRRDQGARRRC